MFRFLCMMAIVVGVASSAGAQGQAINGTIEGTVTDESGGVLPGVVVTLTNLDTGVARSVVTNQGGGYRAPLLPLGVYRIAAELPGFKRYEQSGLRLTAGQVAVVNVELGVGALEETVSVTIDATVVDLGKIEQGRTLNEQEIKTLPLTSRNPYNFALLQPGVVGFETQEFGVPRLTSNGALLRVNYQIDGNDNTQKDRLGLRQMPMSEVMIREVKVVTTGYAPEFGQTMGLVYNAITPSGTNALRGQASYRFQREPFVAFPFFTANRSTKPPTEVNIYTVDAGGPIVRDRTHFFAGFENARRDFSGGRVVAIAPASAARLGLTEPLYIPAAGNTKFAIGKVDHQLASSHRLTGRYIFFDNLISDNIGATTVNVPNSVQQGTDFTDRQHSIAGQLVSTFGNNLLNEVRVQYASRDQGRVPGANAGTGPAIRIPQVANFGGPVGGASDAGFAFEQGIFQVLENLTYIRGDHGYKFGFSGQFVADSRTQTQIQLYTFPSIDAYLAARSGAAPFGYTSLQQFFGDPGYEYDTRMFAFFVQDDWRLTPDLKVLYGLRYDVYSPPDPSAQAVLASSQEFRADSNNWQPRAGFVWSLGRDGLTVLRGNTGLAYDQPINALYEQAIVNDGTTRRGNVAIQPSQAGAPAFPNVLTTGNVTAVQSPWTVDPDFAIARMWQSNVQFERGFGAVYAAAVGFSFAKGYDLPVVTNVNVINPVGTLADGRPVYSTAVNANTRRDPRFNAIFSTQSIGESTYKAVTFQLARRPRRGIQFDLAYTLGKAEDTAPTHGTSLVVEGDAGGRSDPSNLDRDKGPNILDQRHTFVGSIVAQPEIGADGVAGAILNHNQFGILLQFASGIPVTVRSNLELNNDAIASDRPVNIGRGTLALPARYNVDLRYSRLVPFGPGRNAEVLAELKNVFNTVQWARVNSVVTTDAQGVPLAPVPTDAGEFRPTGGYEQRQFQLGFRVTF